MGKRSRSVPYAPIIPPTYDPFAREKERERAKREEELYLMELEAEHRREEQVSFDEEDERYRREWLAEHPDYGPDHVDWGRF